MSSLRLRALAARGGVAVSESGGEVLIVADKQALQAPPDKEVVLPPLPEAPGLLLADGSINWGCPCLGGMATGPCGNHFRDAFSCFHYSEADPKGSDCYEKFSVMQECMAQFPELYGKDDDDDNELSAALAAGGGGSGGQGGEGGAHPPAPAPAARAPAPAGDN